MKNPILIVVIVILLIILGVSLFSFQYNKTEKITDFESCVSAGYPVLESYPRQCRTPDGQNFVDVLDSPQNSLSDYFEEQVKARVINRIGTPIEGFEPPMLLQVYPGMQESDFNNVDTIQGIYEYRNNMLAFRLRNQPEHSAARAITSSGFSILYSNIQSRLDENSGSRSEVDAMLYRLTETQNEIYCTPEMRNIEVCTALYQPVCGWNNQNIQCFTYPCASTYSNACEACANPDVEYYTVGECPSPGSQ